MCIFFVTSTVFGSDMFALSISWKIEFYFGSLKKNLFSRWKLGHSMIRTHHIDSYPQLIQQSCSEESTMIRTALNYFDFPAGSNR